MHLTEYLASHFGFIKPDNKKYFNFFIWISIIIFAWILIRAWKRVLKVVCYCNLNLDRNNLFQLLAVDIFLTIVFLIFLRNAIRYMCYLCTNKNNNQTPHLFSSRLNSSINPVWSNLIYQTRKNISRDRDFQKVNIIRI